VAAPTFQAPVVGNGRPSTPPVGAPLEKRVMLTFGPLTEARARQILEEQLAAVWAAALESHGYDWREGWSLRWEDFRLERVGAPPTPSSFGPGEAEGVGDGARPAVRG
jgi:hypothetical protein